jgi:hypothetical protein
MKAGFVLVLIFGCAAAILPVRAQAAGPTVLEKGVYSYQAPVGWRVPIADLPEAFASASVGPRRDGFAPHLYVFIRSSPKPLPDFVADYLRTFQSGSATHFKVVDQRPFSTTAGLDGIRVAITYALGKLHLQEIFYFFDGGSGKKIVATACRLATDDPREAPVFDASLKTFTLE